MAKFQLNPNEQLVLEGRATYLQHKILARQGTAYLTTERLVFCGFGGFMAFAVLGPILSMLMKSKNEIFSVSINEIRSVTVEKHGFVKKYVVASSKGEAYALQFFSGAEQWVELLQKTIR